MRWSLTLGSFKGTAVRIHITFLLFLAWIGFSAYQRGGLDAARDSVLFIVAIFACVVLHEFGHILTARRFGIVPPSDAAADRRRGQYRPDAGQAIQELLIAVAGPAVNVVLATLLFFAAGAIDTAALTHVEIPGSASSSGSRSSMSFSPCST